MSTTAYEFNTAADGSPFPLWRQLTAASPRKTYVPSIETDEVVVKGLHFGQRKLMLSEVEYLSWILLTNTATVSDGDRASTGTSSVPSCSSSSALVSAPLIVVYAGAANGTHLPLLFSLFPMIKFILIDPHRFCDDVEAICQGESSQLLQIIHGCCTDEVCKEIRTRYPADRHAIHLISDIRSGNPPDLTNWESTQLIEHDNRIQAEWCTALQSVSAMLKFHPPYPSKDPAVDPTPASIRYFKGSCLWGIWAPRSSSEVRLVVLGPFDDTRRYTEEEYNCTEFEERCCYYNTTDRYDADVKGERAILETFVTHVLKKKEGEREEVVLALSNRMSVQLGTHLLTPLEPTFTQDDARLFAFLHAGMKVNIKGLFKKFRPLVKLKYVVKWVASRVGGELDENRPPNGFWGIVNRKNIMEAYGVKLNSKRQR